MKPRLYYASVVFNIMFLLCMTACTQPPESTGRNSRADGVKETNIASIQKAYADVIAKSNRGGLDSISFKYSCHGEKGGTVRYFTEKGQLRMIVHRYNEYDHYSAEDRYFVKDSTLFFTLTSKATWAFESGAEGATKDNITDTRVYLVDGQPIKCLEKKFTIRSQAKENPRSEMLPSREVDCPAAEAVMKQFLLLTSYRSKPTSGCLD